MSESTSLASEFPKTILPELAKKLGYKNYFACPRVTKVKVAASFGKSARKGGSSNAMDEAVIKKISKNLAVICGQKPRVHRARIAVSNFKLKKGMVIGLSATLRGTRALDFINRLNAITLPRVRDFRGISLKSFDGHGNYSLGIKDHNVFPEIQPDESNFTHGLEITITSSAKNDKEGQVLLKLLGFPFKKQ